MSTPRIVVSCGEVSGDQHAARIINALKSRQDVVVSGIGGDECRAAGMALKFHVKDFAILGFTAVVMNLPKLIGLEAGLKRELRNADLFIAVDYPGMNMRLVRHAAKLGVPVLYYISPQLWAWGEKRVAEVRSNIDRMAVILPFEEQFYRERGVEVEFVGHPFVHDHPLPDPLPQSEREGVALLPGSRLQEVTRILPDMLKAAELLTQRIPGVTFSLGMSPTLPRIVYDRILKRSTATVSLSTSALDVMRTARAALVASGTATLQTAMMQTPLTVVYRVSALNYAIARRVVRVDNIGLVNVVLGERVCPELIQNEATPQAMADSVQAMWEDGEVRDRMVARLKALPEMLRGSGGAKRVAAIAKELLQR